MRRILVRLAAVAAVVGGGFGITSTAQAQSVTVCANLHTNVQGTPVDVEQCQTLPPA